MEILKRVLIGNCILIPLFLLIIYYPAYFFVGVAVTLFTGIAWIVGELVMEKFH